MDGLLERHGLLERLSRIQRSISHGVPLDEVFAAIAAGAADLLGDPVSGLRLVDEDDPGAMRLVAATGLTMEQLREVEHGRVGEGAGGRAIAEDAVVVVEDYPATSDGLARFGEYGVQNALAAPVRAGTRVVGSLTVATFEPGRRYGQVEQEILAALAEHAGLALADAALLERAEQRRRDQDALYRQIVDSTHDGVWMTDPDDRTVFVNDAMARMLGRAPEDIVGRPPTDFMAPEQARVVRAAMERRRQGVAERYEATLLVADGTPLHLAISGTPMFEDGRFTGSLALCADITAQTELESRLRQAQEHAVLGRLAGQVAHDFNQVLSVVRGYAELLVRRAEDERTREDLGAIIEAAEHGAALARQLTTYSRRDAGQPEVVDLAEVTRRTAQLVTSTAPAGVTVESRASEPVPVRIDPTRLRQVLMNLVDNAFDALESGGELLLQARSAGDQASLTVSDSGSGMPADVVARALEPAFTTKPVGEGTGLGLSIVHGVVRGAGGRLSLDSRPGVGTTIEVLLPLAGAPAPAAADAPAAPATILLVEDDASVLDLTRRLLAEHGYAVIAAPDAERGVAAAREHAVDLLLTDQTLPGATGLELARLVGEIRPGTPAIVMSGYVAETAASRPSGVDWLPKPFGGGALLERVRDALARGAS